MGGLLVPPIDPLQLSSLPLASAPLASRKSGFSKVGTEVPSYARAITVPEGRSGATTSFNLRTTNEKPSRTLRKSPAEPERGRGKSFPFCGRGCSLAAGESPRGRLLPWSCLELAGDEPPGAVGELPAVDAHQLR